MAVQGIYVKLYNVDNLFLIKATFSYAMNSQVKDLIEDPSVINYKEWWLLSEDEEESILLAIFSFYDIGDVPSDYLNRMNSSQVNKLQLLSLISLCETSSEITYDDVKRKCNVTSDDSVENLLIRAEQFIDLKIDSVKRNITINKHKASRDIYCGEPNIPFHSPSRSKAHLLSMLKKWRDDISE